MHSIVNMPVAVLLTFTVPFFLFVLAMSHMSPFVGIALVYLGLVVFAALWGFVGQRTGEKPQSMHSAGDAA